MNKKLIFTAALLAAVMLPQDGHCEHGGRISLNFVEFYPPEVRADVPFEIIFKLANTGTQPATPYAEVTLSGEVLNEKGAQVLKPVDKKYNIYNFWPGDRSGKQRYYIGPLPSGEYKLRVDVNAFIRVKNVVVSNETFEMTIIVK